MVDPALAQVAREHGSSPHWQSQVDRLRQLARGTERGGYKNSTGPLDERTWAELRALEKEGRRPASERPRAHRKGRLTEAAEGNRHVHLYRTGCRKYARSLGSETLAERVHALVCGTGYLVGVAGFVADREWELGYPASAMAAHIHRLAYFGVGTAANRMMWERHRPLAIPLDALADASLRLSSVGGIGTLDPSQTSIAGVHPAPVSQRRR